MENGHLMDGFSHLEVNGPVGWWMEVIGVFCCLFVCMWWMEEIVDELDEKWTEKGNLRILDNSALYVYPVDRPPARSTGHTKTSENQVPVICCLKCTGSVPGRPDPVPGRLDTHDNVGVNWDLKFTDRPGTLCTRSTSRPWCQSDTLRILMNPLAVWLLVPVDPVDITTMMSIGYSAHPDETPAVWI